MADVGSPVAQPPQPLPPVAVLVAYGLWAAPAQPRDVTNDVTDDAIAALL